MTGDQSNNQNFVTIFQISLIYALLDMCLSQEISQGGAKLEVTHQLKIQSLLVQIDAMDSQIAVHLNTLLQQRNVI